MSDASAAAHADWKPQGNPWLIAVAVTIATFMEVLDTTIVNVALPHIAGSLSASADEATWALTSYLVANGIVLTISGWLGDLLGRKRYFVICIAMFTVCSFLCGAATSLVPAHRLPPRAGLFRRRHAAQPAIDHHRHLPARAARRGVRRRGHGDHRRAGARPDARRLHHRPGVNWRWIFFLNIPVGIIAVVLVMALVEDPPWVKERKSRGIDFIGLSLITIGLGCLEVMMDRGSDDDWFNSPFIQLMAVLAFLGILGAIFWLLVARKPIVHLDVFKDRNFATGCLMIAATGGILYSSAVMIPQLAQQYLNYNATWSGMILSPGGFMVILLIPIVGRLLKVTAARNLIAAGFTIMGFSMLYSSHLAANINFGTLVSMRLFQTAALAFLFVPISTVAYMTLSRQFTPRRGGAVRDVPQRRRFGRDRALDLQHHPARPDPSELPRPSTPRRSTSRSTNLLATYTSALKAMGHSATVAHDMAMGQIYRTIRTQAAIMAYSDTFVACAFVAFAVVPFCFLMTSRKSTGATGSGALRKPQQIAPFEPAPDRRSGGAVAAGRLLGRTGFRAA